MTDSWCREAIESRIHIADLCTRISVARLAINANRPEAALHILQRALDDAQRHLQGVETMRDIILRHNRETMAASMRATA